MPIIQNGSYYIYQSNCKIRQKKRKYTPIFIFFLIIIVIFLVFYVFTKFNFLPVFGLNKYLIFEEKTYFAVSLYDGEREQVLLQQNNVAGMGGAGYIYKNGNMYFLLSSIYSNRDDAVLVTERLVDYDAKVVDIKLDSLIISADYSSTQINVLKAVLNDVNLAYECANEVIISYDRGEISEGEAKQKMQVFATSCQQNKESLSYAFLSCCDNIVTRAKIFCNQLIANFSAINLSQNFSADAKKLMIENVINFVDLQKNVKK